MKINMKIVFVCTGNLCRSALAETILRKMFLDKKARDVEVTSCGTHILEDVMRDETMCSIAAEHGYYMGGKASAMNVELLDSADLIIVMADRHREEVTRILRYDHWNRIHMFCEYCFGEKTDIPDPHYQTDYLYRRCFDRIEEGCRMIADRINSMHPDRPAPNLVHSMQT